MVSPIFEAVPLPMTLMVLLFPDKAHFTVAVPKILHIATGTTVLGKSLSSIPIPGGV